MKIAPHFGLVIRKPALATRGVDPASVEEALEGAPLDEDEDLLSFGPHFGPDAAETLVGRLESLGLVYIDDFFVFSGDFPEWCAFAAGLNRS